MKVTVCFGNTRIVVPIGEGNVTVAQLTEKALARYRKIAKKDPVENVTVHNIHSEAGILDLDDVLLDVVVDKDVLVAEFEEENAYTPATPLPDIKHIFNQGGTGDSSERTKPETINDSSYFSHEDRMAWVDKWVQDADTTEPPNSTSPSAARDPQLTMPDAVRPDSDGTVGSSRGVGIDSVLRERAAENAPRERGIESGHRERLIDSASREQGAYSIPKGRSIDSAPRERSIDSAPKERSIDSGAKERSIDSAPRERSIDSGPKERSIDTVPRDRRIVSGQSEREIDSVGLTSSQNEVGERAIDAPADTFLTKSVAESVEQIKVVLTKDDLPLGCNVRLVEGPSPGLYVMSIDPGSSAERDGTLRLGDRVVNVNGVDLTDIPLVSVMDVYQEMTTTAQVRLTVQRQPPLQTPAESCPDDIEVVTQSRSKDSFELILHKGQKGLGFTIATREYTACQGYSPIFIKTVHRHGAAATDGRMKPNDVLLKVNGKSVVGMPQQAVVAMMRELKGQVKLFLQRTASGLPPATDPVTTSTPHIPPPPPPQPTSTRTRLSLDISLVAPDGRPVGLGISVKGKSMSIKGELRRDHGIFIKSILKGGAADLDGRLRADDQLMASDNQTLKGLSNKEAMHVLKQTLDHANKMTSLNLVVSRKDCLNLSAESRTSKPYSSFKGSNHNLAQHNASLSADPNRYRALSLSSPNLGRKKKHHVEFDSSRGVAFSENIQSIPQSGDVLESDEDVVFVGHLGEQLDPFNRESLFRKSMKKIDHAPITPGMMRRASSQELLSSTPPVPLLKKGVSQESVFSGKDVDPLYATIGETGFGNSVREPAKVPDSFQNEVQNGTIPAVDVTETPASASEGKPKSKNFLNFFSKKNNKKKDDSKALPESGDASKARLPDFTPGHTSSPHLFDEQGSRHRSSNRSDGDYSSRPRDSAARDSATRDSGVEREHPRAPGNSSSDSASHKRSRSSDFFFRDKELADRNGGYIERRVQDRDYRDDMARGSDRNSDRSNNSGRSSGNRSRDKGYANYPPRDSSNRDRSRDRQVRDNPRDVLRDHNVRDNSRDRLARDNSRDRLARDKSRDRLARDNSRDLPPRDHLHQMRDKPTDSRYPREPSREAAHARDSRDRRFLETTQFRYGRGNPPPYNPDQFQDPARFPAANLSLNNRGSSALDLRPLPVQDNRPPFQPMIPQPISHIQGRQTTEQLSDV